MTSNIDPETVRRIGLALAAQVESVPPKAFDTGPVERVGAILNVAAALIRDDVLRGLDEADKGFADMVRKAIFTFVHIPTRLNPRDVPKLVRVVDAPVLVTALTAALAHPDLADAVEHILANMSQRMAQSLREEIAGRGKIKDKDGEEAMGRVVMAIRELEASGELVLMVSED